jgi:hypothetical protein
LDTSGSVQQEARACPVCGTKFFATADRGFCPICIFCGAASGESAATEERGLASESGDSVEEADGTQVRRFGHYQLMLNETGRPIELGRGAMGVNCKALDVDLRRPVTLKIISERYLGEGSARLFGIRDIDQEHVFEVVFRDLLALGVQMYDVALQRFGLLPDHLDGLFLLETLRFKNTKRQYEIATLEITAKSWRTVS